MKKTMQTITMIFAGVVLLSLSVGLTSCKKAETGPAGTNGTNGTNGSSNVQTFTASVTSLSWTYVSADNEYLATLPITGITSSVVNNGSIQVFIDNTTGTVTEWAAMPFSFSNAQFNYSYKAGFVTVSASVISGTPGNPGATKFKVVVIPPGMIKTNVNVKNYAEFKQAYDQND